MQKVSGSIPSNNKFFFNFTKILVFSLYFASIASFMFMLMLNYPLRVDLKKIKSGYSKFSMKIPNVQSPRLSRLVCTVRFVMLFGVFE